MLDINAQFTHTIVATGVSDPQLLAKWRSEPAILSLLGVNPDTLNIEAFWKFAGLITKIRHNSLRGDYPLTFLALSYTGLEIEIFANYSLRHTALKTAKLDSNEQKASSLMKFLENWLNLTLRDHALIWDIIRHEHALSHTSHFVIDTTPQQSSKEGLCEISTHAIPIVQGSLLVYKMSFDPKVLMERLQRRPVDISNLEQGEFFTGYWRNDKNSQVYMLDLDALGFYILSMINERNSIEYIADKLNGDEKSIKPQDLFAPIQELMNFGLIYLKFPASSIAEHH